MHTTSYNGIPYLGEASSAAEIVALLLAARARDQADNVLLQPLRLTVNSRFRIASSRRRHRRHRVQPQRPVCLRFERVSVGGERGI